MNSRGGSKLSNTSGKYAVILAVLGNLYDRFVTTGYKREMTDVSLADKLDIVKKIPMAKGVTLMYPSEFEAEPEAVAKKISQYGLEVSNVIADTFSDPKWMNGSLTAKDEKVRKEAIELIKNASDAVKKIGVNKCCLWFGQDGHDYLFDDHKSKWRLLIDGLKDITSYNEKVTFFIEYKLKEPRTHAMVSTVGKSLHLINKVGADNLGIVLDTGHANMADENLAESVYLIAESDVPLALHINDNYGYWDDDMIFGSINFWKSVEFIYALEDVGYDGWYEIDVFPYREDTVKAINQSFQMLDYIRRKVKENFKELQKAVESRDVHTAMDTVRRIFLKEYE